jgi:polar amino acid transport system substrate-binding protein
MMEVDTQVLQQLAPHGVLRAAINFGNTVLEFAQLERSATAGEAFAQFIDQGLEVAAGVRQVVAAFASTRSDLRVLDDSFMTIQQAMGVPKDRTEAAAFLAMFIEDMKAQGRIAESLKQSGQTAARVAPAAAS